MPTNEYLTSDEQSRENDPLLPSTTSRRTSSRSYASAIPQAHSPRVIILILFIILFFLAFGGFLMALPSVRMFEDIICHHYYESIGEGSEGKIDERLCKGDEVQNQLNVLLVGLHFLGAIPGLVTTIPYGLLADRIGRKLVLVLSLTGMILAGCWNMAVMRFWRVLPIHLVWLAPVFTFIGGGEVVAAMMLYAIVCDITTESNRSNVFLFGASGVLLGELIAPSVASFLMEHSPWTSLITGFCILVFGTGLIVFVQETLHLRPSEVELDRDSSSDRSGPQQNKLNFFTLAKNQTRGAFKRIYESTTVLHSLPIVFLLATFVCVPFGRQAMDLSLRYISKRFSWQIREVAFLISLRAFVSLVLLLAILPALSYYLTERLHFSPKEKDLSLARYSATLLVVGALILAASPTIGLNIFGLVIFTLGGGFASLTRSLITTLVDKQHVARLYAAIAVVEVATSLASEPSIGALYAAGLKLKGPWIGLPYYGLAIVCFLGGLGVWCFGLVTKKGDRVISHGDEDRDTVVDDTGFLGGDTLGTGTINTV